MINFLLSLSFLYPFVFLLFVIYLICLFKCKPKSQGVYFSNIKLLKQVQNKQTYFLTMLKFLIVFLIITSLASPVKKEDIILNNNQGYEISLLLDASSSMRENDKFNKTKLILKDFINKRSTDRLALSVFADYAYVAVPLTYDKQSLLNSLEYLKIGVAGQRETSLNEALFLGANLFKSKEKIFAKKHQKIIILLTDGIDTTNAIPLEVAIRKAKKYGVKVYTIGLGKVGDYKPDVLQQIAQDTNGKFYEASNLSKLKDIYTQINNLEKSDIKTQKYVSIQYFYQYPLSLAFILLIILLLVTSFNKQSIALKNIFSKEMYKKIISGTNNKKQYTIWLIISLIFILIALYRPVSEGQKINIPQNNFSLVVGFDISRSMSAKDVYPSRALFAQNKFKHLINSFKSQKIGVFGFSNSSFLISPVTNDYDSVKYLVNNIDLKYHDDKGSNILSALKSTNKLLKNFDKKVVILFTDGTDNDDFTKEIEYAKEHNITVFIYAIATHQGTVIKIKDKILKDRDGNIVITHLNDKIKNLATKTNGAYLVYSVSSGDIDEFVNIINTKFKDEITNDMKVTNNKEYFYIPLFLAFVFFMLAISGYSFRGKK